MIKRRSREIQLELLGERSIEVRYCTKTSDSTVLLNIVMHFLKYK